MMTSTFSEIHQAVVVTGGLGRSLYMILAVLVGVYVWRRPQSQMKILWLAAAILSARCFFEAVMCPYYLAPPLFLAMVLVACSNRRRFGAAVMVTAAVSVFAYYHLSPWMWWLPVVAGLAAVLALGYPSAAQIPSLPQQTPDQTRVDSRPEDVNQGRELAPAL